MHSYYYEMVPVSFHIQSTTTYKSPNLQAKAIPNGPYTLSLHAAYNKCVSTVDHGEIQARWWCTFSVCGLNLTFLPLV